MTFPWYAFGLLFLLPFLDPRRPLRLLHFDLVVLAVVGYGPLHTYVLSRQPSGSALITVLGLSYLAARLLFVGFRPRAPRAPLVPVMPIAWLVAALVLLVGFRLAYVLTDRELVTDVGVVSVYGADRIADGDELYDYRLDRGAFEDSDTYGPANYLFYLPFEQLMPWSGEPPASSAYLDLLDAGRVAAVSFDLLTIGALLLLGRRLRPGREGRLLGIALAFAWASYPYSLLALRYGFNDALVALLVVLALVALPSASGRGAMAALAAATKFAPAVIAPVLATGTGARPLRSSLLFAAAFIAVSLALFLPFIPDGGLSELYDRTLGLQQGRKGLNTLWARFPQLDWLQALAQVGVVGLALVVALVPSRKSPVQVVALAAGLIAAVELTMTYWFSAYVLWFGPLAFAAFFAAYDCRGGRQTRFMPGSR